MADACGNGAPHRRHEWIDGVTRRDCPGVPDNLSREAGLALIEDANRWLAAYNKARDEAERAWVVLDWLAENYPAALELCPYKAKR